VDGVWRTRVGYAGGTTPDPTYRDIGNHSECLQVDFDPTVISYDDLLELFWSSHEATRPAYSRQYASLVLAHDDDQLRRAEASRERLEAVVKRPVVTRIVPLERFYLAEDYHQKYRLKADRLLYSEIWAAYPLEADLTDSTVAARLNGFADRSGSCLLLDAEVAEYGLTPTAQAYLKGLCRP
jgi:peptide-methionine (S)-S-oxide reductase